MTKIKRPRRLYDVLYIPSCWLNILVQRMPFTVVNIATLSPSAQQSCIATLGPSLQMKSPNLTSKKVAKRLKGVRNICDNPPVPPEAQSASSINNWTRCKSSPRADLCLLLVLNLFKCRRTTNKHSCLHYVTLQWWLFFNGNTFEQKFIELPSARQQ